MASREIIDCQIYIRKANPQNEHNSEWSGNNNNQLRKSFKNTDRELILN